MKNRIEARKAIIAAFSAQPEVMGIHLFGRETEGKADDYSDFDIIVETADLAKTQANYREVLGSISPISAVLPLVYEEKRMVEMICFKDLSPYHKLDLSILNDIELEKDFGPFLNVYRKTAGVRASITGLRPVTITKDANHQLLDILFSIPRFTKCLFRRDHDAYRRWMGVMRALMWLLYEKYFGWADQPRSRDLPPQDSKKLLAALSQEDRRRLSKALPFDTKVGIAESFRECVVFFADLSQEKAVALGCELNLLFLEHMLKFLNAETERAIGARV